MKHYYLAFAADRAFGSTYFTGDSQPTFQELRAFLKSLQTQLKFKQHPICLALIEVSAPNQTNQTPE